ncbi:hypothetical protein F4777DRAFT_520243 [Nemania sp. FL0916]|nr:hypothetical protein F4777DRAFT_520243 [Nemania sp. FL0916]
MIIGAPFGPFGLPQLATTFSIVLPLPLFIADLKELQAFQPVGKPSKPSKLYCQEWAPDPSVACNNFNSSNSSNNLKSSTIAPTTLIASMASIASIASIVSIALKRLTRSKTHHSFKTTLNRSTAPRIRMKPRPVGCMQYPSSHSSHSSNSSTIASIASNSSKGLNSFKSAIKLQRAQFLGNTIENWWPAGPGRNEPKGAPIVGNVQDSFLKTLRHFDADISARLDKVERVCGASPAFEAITTFLLTHCTTPRLEVFVFGGQ